MMIANEIEKRTEVRTTQQNGVSSKPIILNFYSSSVVNLQVQFLYYNLTLCQYLRDQEKQ